MPRIEDRLASAKMPLVIPDHLALADDQDALGVGSDLYTRPRMFVVHTVAVAVEAHQTAGADPGRTLRITVKAWLQRDQMRPLGFIGLPHALPGKIRMRVRSRPLQATFFEMLVEFGIVFDLRTGNEETAANTWFSTCPFSQPAAGVHAVGSNR